MARPSGVVYDSRVSKPWHVEAIKMKLAGVPVREIARRCDRSLGSLAMVFYPKCRESQRKRDRRRRTSPATS